MADHLRAMVLRLGYNKTLVYCCELRTYPCFEPHWRVAAILQEYVPFHGVKDITRHDNVAQRTTMEVGILKQHGGHSMYSPTRSVTSWRTPTASIPPTEQVVRPRHISLSSHLWRNAEQCPWSAGYCQHCLGWHQQHSSCGTIADHHYGVTKACFGGCIVEQGTTSGWRHCRSMHIPVTQ
jgi:hypothetical protein